MREGRPASDMGTVAIGIDVGGTFTDLVALHADGRVRTVKVLSQPGDRAGAVLHALSEAGVPAKDIAHIAHGTTVVTNLLLERRGARVVACATAGFTDLLELRRQERASLYDLTLHHPDPLVGHADVVSVHERLVPGDVLQSLTPQECARVASAVLDREPDTVAITLLHAYDNASHEVQLGAAIEEEATARGLSVDVVCSHAVLPEMREYERSATTVAEAYARPAVRQYLGALSARLAQQDYPAPRVMTSSGGTLPASDAAQHAAALALSGPAGGVTGAAAFARVLGLSRALTIDIGGTSADVGLIDGGEPLVERGSSVGGVPIALPRVLVEAVAAGGGSVAWIDDGGALRTGPHSAGASPGPAAYGRGGTQPTVTDAHVVLGHIASGAWSGGVHIHADLAQRAVERVAEPLGVSVTRAAEAIVQTADATMARALRRISVERGIDPRDMPLMAFGGGGPLHACGLADRLGMTRIVIPPHAGVLSALGLAMAPERRERISNCVVALASWSDEALHDTLRAAASALGGAPADTSWWLRTRYVGQGYELDIPVSIEDRLSHVIARFGERHRERTGYVLPRDVECISLRTAVQHAAWPAVFERAAADAAHAQPLDGPAVITLPDATLHVASGWRATALEVGGWMLERLT